MSYQDRLRDEINAKLDTLAEQGERWVATWIANAICTGHTEGLTDNEHRDFWLHCAFKACRTEVVRIINRRAGDLPDEDGAQQNLLPGWNHLQAYYQIERDGEQAAYPIQTLTDDELTAKEGFHRSMAQSCSEHADELAKYRRTRRLTAA